MRKKQISRRSPLRERLLWGLDAKRRDRDILRRYVDEAERDLNLYHRARKAGLPVISASRSYTYIRVPTRDDITSARSQRKYALERLPEANRKVAAAMKKRRNFPVGTIRRILAGPRANYRLTRAQLSKIARKLKKK